MKRSSAAGASFSCVCIIGLGAIGCADVSGNSTSVLSIVFDSLAAPSVVVGDTLRDTTGAVVRPVVHAFNFKGQEIIPAPVHFLSPDSGITVDSATGIVVADSLRSTPARIVATVGSLQAVQTVVVTLSPDLIQAVNGLDTLQYSLTDSTLNVSTQLQVKLTHGTAPNDSAVNSYIVSFAIVAQSNPQLGQLVNDAGNASVVATTDASGIAGTRIRVRPLFLTSAPVDSIVVNATAKYRGVQVNGSPVRLVLLLKPPG
ncbi:MAG TPA: hypothetical protein VN876_10000 [Gemmatimonadaceae bacterium]|nr:hypothetical protein [Gemmatimonadaceae bacterium]